MSSASIALVANGLIENDLFIFRLLQGYSQIVAVDGGLNHCHRLGVFPHLIIGDLDSADPAILRQYPDVPQQIFSRDKDETDLELALKAVLADLEAKAVVFGATGLRLDHTLANLHLLGRYPGRLRFETDREIFFSMDSMCELDCHQGQVLSLIPLEGPVKGVTTRGLRWELQDATLDKHFFSVSNECKANRVHLSLKTGEVVCILQRDKFGSAAATQQTSP